jgi:hypothetical protein
VKDQEQKNAAPAPESAEDNVPFFARFLEGQATTTQNAHGPVNATLKYPSDRDEWIDCADV